MKPAACRIGNLAVSTREGQEALLRNFLGSGAVCQNPVACREDHPGMAPHDFREGIRVALRAPPVKQGGVFYSLGRPVHIAFL
jgi:hypothetical protein